MKSHLRKSAASGSDRAKVDRLIRLGWAPGRSIGDILARPKIKWPTQGREASRGR